MIRTQHQGPVTTIVMSRPPVNAIDPEFVTAFNRALDEVDRADPTLLVVRSDQRAFCAGADLSLIRSYFEQTDGIARLVAYVRTLHALFDRIEALPSVTLACINGHALGGGLELALACDLRIASFAASLGLPEARVGMIPGAGGTQRLPRLVGPGVAKRVILGADVVDGAEAQRLGIVQWAVEPDAFEGEIARVAERVGGLSKAALQASKDCIAAYYDPAVDGFEREIDKPLQIMANPDSKARITQFFASRGR
jgi:enoyl-CoA hydratase/carnithine racemase